ncbi:MAG: hypothetical protein NT056_05655 [Proteobacteria bacterium]|nr:hypothetical protein [Pseudomonadota bacterium]
MASLKENSRKMARKAGMNDKLQSWIDARIRHRLTHAQVQMARELGMNPKKFGKLDNSDQERWKTPLPEYIESLYLRRFNKEKPDVVLSIEDRARLQKQKKDDRREEKKMEKTMTIGGAWYLPEQWNKLKEISVDRDDLEDTYEEWLANAEQSVAKMSAAGVTVKKIMVEIAELEAWCRAKNLKINGKSRAEFVANKMREEDLKSEC